MAAKAEEPKLNFVVVRRQTAPPSTAAQRAWSAL